MAEKKFEYKIVKNYGAFGASGKWQKCLTLISWNGKPPVYDIRSWSEDMKVMGKGLSLSDSEMFDLMSMIEDVLAGERSED